MKLKIVEEFLKEDLVPHRKRSKPSLDLQHEAKHAGDKLKASNFPTSLLRIGNWENNHQHGTGTGSGNPQLPSLSPSSHVRAAGGGSVSIWPGSMADRARLAKIPQPEAALKCPRCESIDTKFCYFNNYSLSQPRYFCKTCRRYWTRWGALRNVRPVGGGCRRNKKNKSSSSSKSTASSEKQGGSNSTNAGNISSEITGVTSGQQAEMGFQVGTQQQFRFFKPTNGLYSFQSESMEGSSSIVGESQLLCSITSSSRVSDSQLAPVKMENSNQGINLSTSVMGVSENKYWGGNSWTDLSGLKSQPF
ncbi:hypothetical protein V6N12_009186 [Hibiscus sabdariffa]|uniref:Dof zinc finger protein n=1 Tax=Hibiscus sabdariffa TaxID=183260 RepID=A0ABR2C6D5_9ROSI